MSESLFQTEAIVLQSINFKENDKILTLFSLNAGLIKIYIRMRSKHAFLEQILATPLTVGEYVYQQGRTDLFFFRDGTIIEQYQNLKTSWESLAGAKRLAESLLQSQCQGEPAPELYQLFRLFLKELPKSEHFESLIASFMLKILKHDGVLSAQSCTTCHIPLESGRRFGGERFCDRHAPPHSIPFSLEQEHCLYFLSHCRSLHKISSFPIPTGFLQIVETFFHQALPH